MDYFGVELDSLFKGTYLVTLRITIYREKYGKYPGFLSNFEPKRKNEGYDTKFWFIAEDEDGYQIVNKNKEDAEMFANRLESKYRKMIEMCEDTGDWDLYPFKEWEMIYHK